ncbi:MAG: flagellar biosynthesis protein FlhA [Planctomycetota bacterium]|nr:MAG: flagellar biosynthesis protein FlhA [Planctomycetota bacterium]
MAPIDTTAGAQSLGERILRRADWLLAIGVLGLILTLITPIPPLLLDLLLALNISLSLLLLLVTMNVRKTSELSTFPTLLLFATLFRLGLNVASTRLILTDGEAGHVIEAFGRSMVGGNLAVGLVVFLILVIIQFIVITKGSGRVSEVAARFILDAMPGKQMAIDADLNAGIIDTAEARTRRDAIASEAEFYGAMDGASKFVRGDAIAGLIITALNLVGGIALGAWNGLSLAEAGKRYSMLSVGDGLVSQIPALFVSTAAAVLVTRSNLPSSLGESLVGQIALRRKPLLIAAGTMSAVGFLPGMPLLPFAALAGSLYFAAKLFASDEEPTPLGARATAPGAATKPSAAGAVGAANAGDAANAKPAEGIDELLQVDRVALEIGYRLIPLVQDKSGTGILDHISQLRRRFALREGVVLPAVRIRDNIRQDATAYRILIGGQEVGRGTVEPGHFLAMDGGQVGRKLQGKETRDPAFGLPAWWIRESQREEAELQGYTVIDATSVLVTHLSEMLRGSLGEILTRDDVKELVENVKRVSPAVVQELLPERMSYGDVQKVLRNLLREGVPIRNMALILETLADHAAKTKDPEALTEHVRTRLGRVLCELVADKGGTVRVVTLDPAIEARLAGAVGLGGDAEPGGVNPAYLQALMERIADSVAKGARGGANVAVLVRSNVRRFVNEMVRQSLPKVAVLSYNEVVPARAVETAGIVRMED